MDIFRSDLNAGFKNKLFETEIEHVNDRNIVLENNKLVCELSSGKTKNGFKIKGHLINNVVNDCDRCLHTYTVKDKLKIHFNIYNHSSSIYDRKDDILYWPSKKDSIDIRDYLLEILLVEVPFKKLCSTNCKGICIKCGSNRNDESCLCKQNK